MILPFAIGAMLLTVFLFVFQYDRCLLEQDMGLLTLYAGTLDAEDEEEISGLIKNRASEIFMDKYVAWEMDKLQITMEKNEVRIEGRGKMLFPLPGWNFFNDENVWETGAQRSTLRISPVDFIRTYRRIQGGDK